MKKWLSGIWMVILANFVSAGLIGDIGNSFRGMISDGNFSFFLLFVLFFVILYAILNGAAKMIPVFKGSDKNRKVFSISLSLLVSVIVFGKYGGNVMEALGPYGRGVLILLAILFALALLYLMMKKVGGGNGSAGSALKWILFLVFLVLALWVISSMFGGSGRALSGNIGNLIAFNIFIVKSIT